eukprot:GHVL01024549.1.p1 GENE.GHVL01024549.1~~GHVL01024549.1.p1  ORF type:complete len:178 (+),score=23.18 GHVL01024549.1:64-597(+)
MEDIGRHPVPVATADVTYLTMTVAGDSSVGKTSLVLQMCSSCHEQVEPTTGCDYYFTKHKKFGLSFLDLSGADCFVEIRSEFYKEAHGCLIVYDISKRESFNSLDSWLEEAYKYGGQHLVFTVLGNKTGQRRVPESEGRRWASSKGFSFFEVSLSESLEPVLEHVVNSCDNSSYMFS